MPLSSDRHIIDNKFKSSLDHFSMKPANRVWLRVAHSLNVNYQKSSAKRILIIAGILMVIGTSAGLFETMHHSKISSSTKHKQVATQKQLASLQPDQNQSQVIAANDIITESDEDENASEIIFPLKKYSYKSLTSLEKPLAEIKRYPSQDVSNELISVLPSYSLSMDGGRFSVAKEIIRPQASRTDKMLGFAIKTYYLGLAGSFNSTWFYDQSALKSTNVEYQPSFGGSYSIQGGYILTKHWGIQAACILSSWEGQRYKNLNLYGRTTSLEFNQQSISLTYMQIPVLMQYKLPMFSEMLNTPMIFNILLGGQYGKLMSYRIDEAKDEETNNHLFKKSEFAAVAGFDYDFMVNRPVFYSLGLRASYGTNIFKADEANYFQFEAPHNFIIGVHGAVNFSFSK